MGIKEAEKELTKIKKENKELKELLTAIINLLKGVEPRSFT